MTTCRFCEEVNLIPKVSDQYTQNKINTILDTAEQLLMQRPLYKINMKDIVRETGFSQGGVYKYFSNIEEVWLALARRYELSSNFNSFLEQLFALQLPPKATIKRIFDFLTQEIIKSLDSGFSKLALEFNAIYASQLEQLQAKQLAHHMEQNEQYGYNYFFEQMAQYISQCEQKGLLKPLQSIPSIILYIQVTLDGIVRNATIERYLPAEYLDPEQYQISNLLESMINNLYIFTMSLLGETDMLAPK